MPVPPTVIAVVLALLVPVGTPVAVIVKDFVHDAVAAVATACHTLSLLPAMTHSLTSVPPVNDEIESVIGTEIAIADEYPVVLPH